MKKITLILKSVSLIALMIAVFRARHESSLIEQIIMFVALAYIWIEVAKGSKNGV